MPTRERIVALTMQRYNAMLSGVYELLAARRQELEAYQQYLLAVRDYWIARGALERSVATRLDTLKTTPPTHTATATASPTEKTPPPKGEVSR